MNEQIYVKQDIGFTNAIFFNYNCLLKIVLDSLK